MNFLLYLNNMMNVLYEPTIFMLCIFFQLVLLSFFISELRKGDVKTPDDFLAILVMWIVGIFLSFLWPVIIIVVLSGIIVFLIKRNIPRFKR